jgi:hypothetical protein
LTAVNFLGGIASERPAVYRRVYSDEWWMMSVQALAAELDFLAWRDAQMAAVTEQLETALPALVEDLIRQIEEAGKLAMLRAGVNSRATVERRIADWGSDQMRLALLRADGALTGVMVLHASTLSSNPELRKNAGSMLANAAGVGLIAGSLAAVPAIIVAAVGTTGGVFGFFATSTISLPILVTGVAGVGLASLAGSTMFEGTFKHARNALRARLSMVAERVVLGVGAPPDARSLLSDIQAAVLTAGQTRIGTVK